MGTWPKITSLQVVCLLLLSACASRPIDIAEEGRAPNLTSGVVELAQTSGGDGASTLANEIMTRLRAAGVATAQAGERAGFLLEVVYSERPWRVGAYSGDAPQKGAPDGWIASPGARPWWAPRTTQICTLAVRVIEGEQSREAYRVRASGRGRGAACGKAHGLTEAVTSKLAPSV